MSDAPDYDSYLSSKVQHEVERLRAVNAELHASLRMMEGAKERIEAVNAALLEALEELQQAFSIEPDDLEPNEYEEICIGARRKANIAIAKVKP